jgi:2-polyprenyl-3-methyl-5-hydroxy-6-metoxy-1,4-benzoquinol methylase
MTDPVHEELTSLGVIDPAGVTTFYPRTRDRDDVCVLRDRSGLLFLDRSTHITQETYSANKGTSYWSAASRAEGLRKTWEDDSRRAEQIRALVSRRRWLDVGCGLGGTIELLKGVAQKICAVEPQEEARALLGVNAVASLRSYAPDAGDQYDIITLFHVFEHMREPLAELKHIHSLLASEGIVWIEVPQARDWLIANCEAFRAHTFWSEHLVLHTRESLRRYLETAGFTEVSVQGFQRYGWANHVGWLLEGKPGGQLRRPELCGMDREHAELMCRIDATDTLIAVGRKASQSANEPSTVLREEILSHHVSG